MLNSISWGTNGAGHADDTLGRSVLPAVDPKTAERAKVLLITHNGSSLFAIGSDFFKSLVGPKVSARDVAQALESSGLPVPRSKTCRTRQVPIPGLKKRPIYYCLVMTAE